MSSPVYIDDILPGIEKAARYIGGEVGAVLKPLDAIDLHVGLCFPDIYEVAESYLGQKILYQVLNDAPNILAERVYAPWLDMARALREKGRPLFALETRTAISALDLLAFSVNHELAYTSILHMLDLGGISLRAKQRGEADPIVIAGGPACANPEVIAPFFDAIFLGDGEDAILEIAQRLIASKGQPRADRVQDLAAVEGIYLPDRYQPYFADKRLQGFKHAPEHAPSISARKIADLDKAPSATRWIAPHLRVVHDRAAVEIQRGCSRGCRFCQAGMIYRPTRQRSPQTVQDILRAAVQSSGSDQAGLLSLSAGDYPLIEPLLADLQTNFGGQRVSLSIPSLRTETLSPGLAREMLAMRGGGFTLAPEAATERLRQVISKGNTELDLLNAVRAAMQAGASHLKLYFMIGLPTETDEDVAAIPKLCAKMLQVAKSINKNARINVSVSTFVPKAHTPFQWEAQAYLAQVQHKQTLLFRGFRDSKVKARWHDPNMSLIEGIYARGDRRLADVLEQAFKAGAHLDAWSEFFDPQLHLDALAAQGLCSEDFLRARDLDEALPWDVVDLALLKKFLLRERADAYAVKQREDCVIDSCHACGVCDFDLRRVLTYRALQLQKSASGAAPKVLTQNTSDDDKSITRVVIAQVANPLKHRSNNDLHLADSSALAQISGSEQELVQKEAPRPSSSAENAANLRPGQRAADVKRQSLRLRLRKHSPAIFLSHLETMATLQRAFSRANVPLAYSGGFSPRPYLSMPFALPVGASSDDELVDIELHRVMDPQEVLHLLAEQLPRGLTAVDVMIRGQNSDRLGKALGGALWQAKMAMDPREIEAAVARYVETPTWILQRRRKKRVNEVDLKTLAMDFWPEDGLVRFRLRTPAEGSIKPSEALASIFGEEAIKELQLHKLKSLFAWDFASSAA